MNLPPPVGRDSGRALTSLVAGDSRARRSLALPRSSSGSWSQCAPRFWRSGLPMNRERPTSNDQRQTLDGLEVERWVLNVERSWSQCVPILASGLPMNLVVRCRPFRVSGRGSRLKPGQRTPPSSWSQCLRKNERGLPMNRLESIARSMASLGQPKRRSTGALQKLRLRACVLECGSALPLSRFMGRERVRKEQAASHEPASIGRARLRRAVTSPVAGDSRARRSLALPRASNGSWSPRVAERPRWLPMV